MNPTRILSSAPGRASAPQPSTSTRRQFLKAAAVVPFAWTGAAADAPSKPPLVDTHLHCFAGAANARFPYHSRAPYEPAEAATPQHLLRCMDGAGVDYAVVVHPEPYQDDHSYLEYCLTLGAGRLKGTCLVFADQPGSMEKLPALVKRLPIVAARIHAYAPDRLPPFDSPELRRLWKTASDHGVAMQLHFEPRHAAGFEPLIREFADTLVVIDHLGRPFQGTPDEHRRVVQWGRLKNTVIKLSAIPAPESYPHRDIRPVIRELAEAYGPDRMIYGGGFNAQATPQSYRAAFEQARAYLSHWPDSDQDKVFGRNAVRLFRFRG